MMRSSARHAGQKIACAPVERDDPCWFFFTSGTTGRPKAAVLTHGQMAFVITNHLCDLMPGTGGPGDASIVVAPLSHGAGIHQLTQVAHAVKTILPASEKLDVPAVWQLIERWQVTNAFTVPTILKMLVEDPACDRFDHSSLRYVIYAGAPMYRADQKQALSKLGAVLVQYFGLGEVTGNITVLPPACHAAEDGPQARIGTCGFERTGMQIEIQGRSGRRGGAWFDRRNLRDRACRVCRLLQQPRSQCEILPQWMVPHRRSRPHGRAGLRLHHRSFFRHVYLRRFQHLSRVRLRKRS